MRVKFFALYFGLIAASFSLQSAASARSIPNNYTCYNTNAIAIDDWREVNVEAIAQATRQAGGRSLRLPGGDTANYWDWDLGSIVEWYDQGQPRQPNTFPYFLIEPLPLALNYQYGTNATLKNIAPLITGAGAEPIWVMNMNTSTLEKELRHLQEAAALGLSVTRVELGNELYFGLPNYTRPGYEASQPLQRGNPTPADYAAKAKEWTIAVKAAFPAASVAVIGVSPAADSEPRIKNWLPALKAKTGSDNRSALEVADAFTLHPYYKAESLGVKKSDVGDRARAGEIARGGIAAQRDRLRNPELQAPELQDKQLWITEHTVIEDEIVVLGNTWVHALMMDVQTQDFLQDNRTEVACAHTLTGNPQWQAIVNESGLAIDPSQRGISNRPFANVAQPFSATAIGLVLGKTAEIFDGGEAEPILSKAAAIGWLVKDESETTLSIVNASDERETFSLPAGETWEVVTYTGDPWATITAETDLKVSRTVLAGGSQLNIPAFSKIVAKADLNAARSQTFNSNAALKLSAIFGIGLAASMAGLFRWNQLREKT